MLPLGFGVLWVRIPLEVPKQVYCVVVIT